MEDEFDRFLKVFEKYQQAKAEAENPPPLPARVPVAIQPERLAGYYAEKLKVAKGDLRRCFVRAVSQVMDEILNDAESKAGGRG